MAFTRAKRRSYTRGRVQLPAGNAPTQAARPTSRWANFRQCPHVRQDVNPVHQQVGELGKSLLAMVLAAPGPPALLHGVLYLGPFTGLRSGHCGQACPRRPLAASPAPDEAVDHLPAETVDHQALTIPDQGGLLQALQGCDSLTGGAARRQDAPRSRRSSVYSPPRWAPGGPGPW